MFEDRLLTILVYIHYMQKVACYRLLYCTKAYDYLCLWRQPYLSQT